MLEKEFIFTNNIIKIFVNFLNIISIDGKLNINLFDDLNLKILLFERKTIIRDQKNIKTLFDQLKKDLKNKDNVENLKRDKIKDILQRFII